MNGTTGGNRGPRRAVALAVPIAFTLLVTACGAVHVHFGSSASSAPAAVPYRVELAYAQCMRAHGLPSFPIPSPTGNSGAGGQVAGRPGSATAQANDACRHLLPGG
jgi:hypothetical protein